MVDRWKSNSLAWALPREFVCDPVHTRYPVMMVIKLESAPRRVVPFHRPRPVGSEMLQLWTRETKLPVTIVVLPPAWNVSFSGMGSICGVGERKITLFWGKNLRAMDRKSVAIWGWLQQELVSEKPHIWTARARMHVMR